VALGNVVLVDHGAGTTDPDIGIVPPSPFDRARPAAGGCEPFKPDPVPARFRPVLPALTHAFPLSAYLAPVDDPEAFRPATTLLVLDPREAMPSVELTATLPTGSETWTPRRDLLASDAEAPHFVVEAEGASSELRFGDGTHGKRPDTGMAFAASYRVGNGTRGNVGAEAIAHVLMRVDLGIDEVRNPLAAAGGVEPEDVEEARRDAPHAFRTQERAVTPADYASAAERRPEVQRAAASFRWTGSWHTVFVTADRMGGAPVDAPFAARMRRHLERFRTAGYDLELDSPRYVPLDLALHVCEKPGFFQGDVVAAVKRVLSSDVLADGTLGLFHPDQFSFGTPVYLSRVIAAVHSVAGVESVHVERFQRLLDPSPSSLEDGVITMGRLEIAMLANNPSFPERGQIEFLPGGAP
jgi:predicted phage baseplate assembly protein